MTLVDRPTVSVGAVADVDGAVRAQLATLGPCGGLPGMDPSGLPRFAEQGPTTPREVTLELLVSPYGPVQTAHVARSEPRDSRSDACVSGAARRWRFAASPEGGVARLTVTVRLAPPR